MINKYINFAVTIVTSLMIIVMTVHIVKAVGIDNRVECSDTASTYLIWTAFISFLGMLVQGYICFYGQALMQKGIDSPTLINLGLTRIEREFRAALSIKAASLMIIVFNLSFLILNVHQLRCI